MSASLKVVALAVICLLAGWLLAGRGSSETRLVFLSVGQGDCAIIQSARGAILVDAGPSEGAAKMRILPKLRQLGIAGVAAVLLTHPDKDHVAGVPVLARQLPETVFAISEHFRENPEWQSLLRDWEIDSSRIVYLPDKAVAKFGDLDLQLFCPPADGGDNDGSLFLKVSDGKATAVLSGDATAESEALAAATGDWSAQIMKAGHHGSKTSTSFSWLGEVKPAFGVVSCGLDNRYGHPHPEVLDRMTRAGVQVLRTDKDGDIAFVLRNGRFEREP